MEVVLRKYGVAATVDFVLYKLDGTGLKTDAASAAGDVTLTRDEGPEETLDADAFVDEGRTYSIALSVAEMTAARIMVNIVDQSAPQVWLDKCVLIETYGHASAQHQFDLSVATQPVNLTQIGGVVQSATDLKDFADDGYDPATNKVQGVVLVDTTTTNTDMITAAAVNAEVDSALNTAIPAVNTANSVNDLLLDHVSPELDTAATAASTAAVYAIVNSGQSFRGAVTNVPGANQFKIGTLAGIGAGVFTDANTPWYAYVFRDAGGLAGAPQGETRLITGYTSADATFTTAAFTAAVGVGDDVIIMSNYLAATTTILADVVAIKAITDLLTLAGIADAVHDEAVEGAHTHRQLMRLVSAALAGKMSGAGTGTETFRDIGDTTDRIVTTLDVANNRTNVVHTV